jgi:hypothetical protein
MKTKPWSSACTIFFSVPGPVLQKPDLYLDSHRVLCFSVKTGIWFFREFRKIKKESCENHEQTCYCK